MSQISSMFWSFASRARVIPKVFHRRILVFGGFACGAGGLASYFLHRGIVSADSGETEQEKPELTAQPAIDSRSLHVRFYQYRTCPFCCKVRAFLDYYGVSYEEIEVNPLFKREIKFSESKAVPFVVVNSLQANFHELHDSL